MTGLRSVAPAGKKASSGLITPAYKYSKGVFDSSKAYLPGTESDAEIFYLAEGTMPKMIGHSPASFFGYECYVLLTHIPDQASHVMENEPTFLPA